MQFLSHGLCRAIQGIGFIRTYASMFYAINGVLNTARHRSQTTHANSRRAASQRVRQRAAVVGDGLAVIQHPFAQLLHQLARPDIGLVEVGVEQCQGDVHVTHMLDFLIRQAVYHIL